MARRLVKPLVLGLLTIHAWPASGATALPADLPWGMAPAEIEAACRAEIGRARQAIEAASSAAVADPLRGLIRAESAVAELREALVVPAALGLVAPDPAVRAAGAGCSDLLGAFDVEVAADAKLYRLAGRALTTAATAADRQLAQVYVERGRRAGAGLAPAARDEAAALLERLGRLEQTFQRALAEERATIVVAPAELAGLPDELVATFEQTAEGYVVPVDLSGFERFMRNAAAAPARRRYLEAFYHLGGPANLQRVAQAAAWRRDLARRLGYPSWAAYRLSANMAGTPARAAALLREVDTRLMVRAKAEIVALTAFKSRELGGGDEPLHAWDYDYVLAQLERAHYSVDAEALRQYFPIDHVVPAVLGIYAQLLGLQFHRVGTVAWADGVQLYSITDDGGDAPLAAFYLDLQPRPGKFLRPATAILRAGRRLADGSYQLPISAIIGNAPAAAPGRPATFSHRGVIEFFHEFGHVMHTSLARAPYATLHAANVRADFAETPSQMLENWAWQPSVLKRVSRHSLTGRPLPDELLERMIALDHVDDGVFWTRQAFLAAYDLALHGEEGGIEPNALWFELMPQWTPLPAPHGTMPVASFMPVMGGYDAGYYGYLWSRVYAQDLYGAFRREGLDNAEIGRRYRREILEPGAVYEPDVLVANFLGRAARPDEFFESLGAQR